MYNEGISTTGDILDLGVQCEIIKKSGTSYSYGEQKFGPGREKAKQMLRENKKLISEMKRKIWDKVKGRQQENVKKTPNNTE